MRFEDLLFEAGIRVSDEQMAAIMADRAAVVSAGAGSGKTTVLSLRFVRLVLSGKAHADEILTLTFTRKAAAEMYERIYSLLSLAAEHDESAALELSGHFPKARISTMDSFWGEIARTDSLRFGVTRDFQNLESDETAEDEMVKGVYEELQGRDDLEPGFLVLSSLYSSRDLMEILRRIAADESDILTSFDANDNTASYTALAETIASSLYSKAGSLLSSLAELDGENPENGQHEEIQKTLEAFWAGDCDAFPQISLNKLRKAADKPIAAFIKESGIRDVLGQLSSLKVLEASKDDARAVSQVIEAFIEGMQRQKRILGLLSYRDAESLCREVLLSNRDVRTYYKKRFRYIMVDEFQDNNSTQRDLLFLLSEREEAFSPGIPGLEAIDPEKLFFVGDDKQSIYYFRGADVSVFRSLKDDVRNMGGLNLSLTANYRSEPALIDHFNSVFSEVFSTGLSEEDLEREMLDEKLTGRKFSSFHATAETIRARGASDGVEPAIELALVQAEGGGEEAADAVDSEAMYIARKILEITTEDSCLIPDGRGGLRRPRYGEIAVLLRTTAPQMPIEKAFRLCGIPYTVQESTSATIEGVGWDIYAFLQLLIYPEDRMAYIALLRSPFARISDDGLLLLSSAGGEAFADDPPFPSEADRAAYQSLKELYLDLRGMAGRRRMTEILTRMFHESGYNAYLQCSGYLSPYAEHFSYIWSAAVLYDEAGRSLPAFLDYLRPLVGQAVKLDSAPVQHLETDGVQIMTIHRSKGLQFPVVFISDADHGSSNQGARENLISIGGCIMPDITPLGEDNLIIREMAAYRRRREEAELRRLLYVAMTRAVDHIIITAHLRRRRTGSSLLDIYMPASGGAEPSIIPFVPAASLFRHGSGDADHGWYDRDVSPEPTYCDRRVGVKDSSHADGIAGKGEELPSLPSDDIVFSHMMQDSFGTAVHAALEGALDGSVPRYSFPPELTDRERLRLQASISSIVSSFLSSDFYSSFIEGRRTEAEVRFYYPADGIVMEGSADLVVFGDEWNLVVDYKTDRFMDESVHMGQITAYAKAMEELYGRKCFAVLLYVRGWRRSTFIDSSGCPVKEPSRP